MQQLSVQSGYRSLIAVRKRAQSSATFLRLGRTAYPYLLMLPAMAIMLGVLVYPWIWTLHLSFHSWSLMRPHEAPVFVGLRNYVVLLQDPPFLDAIWRTLALAFGTVLVEFLLGFGLALLLNLTLPGRSLLRLFLLIPMLLTPSVVGLMWKLWFHYDFGLLNYLIGVFGLPAVGWLSNPSITLVTVGITEVWLHTSFVILVLLAGLQTVPREIIEAAKIDGASRLQVFRHITLPWLQPLILIVLLFRLVFALRVFDTVLALFRSSGPANGGQVLGVYLYEHLGRTWRMGESATISYVMLLLTMTLSFLLAARIYRRGTAG